MIDLHCHILPTVDDGPETIIESLKMVESAMAQGITHIVCTPHHNSDKYWNPKNKIIKAVADLQKIIDEKKLLMTLFEAQEIRLSSNILELIENDECLFIDENNRYLFIELPIDSLPVYAKKVFIKMINQGVTPIIVHPERNLYLANHLDVLSQLIDLGVLTQMTAPSYLGYFGNRVEKVCKEMIELGLIHLVGSDAHSVNHRHFKLKELYEQLERDYSKELVDKLQKNAEYLLKGEGLTRQLLIN